MSIVNNQKANDNNECHAQEDGTIIQVFPQPEFTHQLVQTRPEVQLVQLGHD